MYDNRFAQKYNYLLYNYTWCFVYTGATDTNTNTNSYSCGRTRYSIYYNP